MYTSRHQPEFFLVRGFWSAVTAKGCCFVDRIQRIGWCRKPGLNIHIASCLVPFNLVIRISLSAEMVSSPLFASKKTYDAKAQTCIHLLRREMVQIMNFRCVSNAVEQACHLCKRLILRFQCSIRTECSCLPVRNWQVEPPMIV